MGQGTYLRCFPFARELVQFGHQVTLFTTSRKNRMSIDKNMQEGVCVIEFPDLFTGKFRNGICLWNTFNRILFLKRKRFDIIHAFDSRPNVVFPAIYIKHKLDIPLVMDWADWWGYGGTIEERSGYLYARTLGKIEGFFEEYFRSYAEKATTICTALHKRLEGLGYKASSITTIPQGCDLDKVKPMPLEHCREKLSIPRNNIIIGHLGTLFKSDAELLFQAGNYIQDKKEGVRILLIGRHKLKLKDFKHSPELVIETGEILDLDISFYLGACDIVAIPMKKTVANNGRWPSKINDYIAAAKPIVSTSISDIEHIFKKEGIGLLAEDNPIDFGEAILGLIEDKEKQKLLIAKNKKCARTYLNWSRLSKKLEDIYREALDSRKV